MLAETDDTIKWNAIVPNHRSWSRSGRYKTCRKRQMSKYYLLKELYVSQRNAVLFVIMYCSPCPF